VAGRPDGRRMCLLRPRPRPASRLRVQRSGNLSAKVVTRHGPDTHRQEISGPRRPAHRRAHLAGKRHSLPESSAVTHQ
jgi:hypothetical protein